MNKPLVFAALLALGVTACKPDAPATAEPGADPATAAKPAAASAPDAAQAAAAEEAAARLLAEAAQGPALVEGQDYKTIPNGQPYEAMPGKVEVAEVFGYVCPACAGFQPLVSAWKTKLPANVNFVYVPALFGGTWDNYARAYYAAEALGLKDKTHDAVYRAVHIDQSLKGERGQDTPEEIANFYKSYGADPKQFVETMNSFAIEGKLNKAKAFAQRSGIQGTPSLVVAGKYLVTVPDREAQIRVANQLIARETAGTPAPAAAPATEAPAPAPTATDAPAPASGATE